MYAQGFAQSPEAWYAWGAKINHELAIQRVDSAVFAYKRWLVGMEDDTVRAANLEIDLKDSTRRAAAIRKMVDANDMNPAVAFTRWLIGEEAVVALLERKTTTGRGPTPYTIMLGILGPRLRGNARVGAISEKLKR